MQRFNYFKMIVGTGTPSGQCRDSVSPASCWNSTGNTKIFVNLRNIYFENSLVQPQEIDLLESSTRLRLRWLKKKLEKLEKKSKKNGKLTQREEEIKEIVIEEKNFLLMNFLHLLPIMPARDLVIEDEKKPLKRGTDKKIAMDYQQNQLADKGHDYTFGPEINAQIGDVVGNIAKKVMGGRGEVPHSHIYVLGCW